METWVRLPTRWILDEDNSFLKSLKWDAGERNSYNTASLMVLVAIATNTSYRRTRKNPEIGTVELSYTDLTTITTLSRKLVSESIKKLTTAGLIEKSTKKKVNRYTLCNLSNELGWGKLPAKRIYEENLEKIKAFKYFTLRKKAELNALKLYFLIISLRDNDSNMSHMTYETIMKYTGIHRGEISSAISLLASNDLIKVIKVESQGDSSYLANAYRLVGIDPYNHEGSLKKSAPKDMVNQ